jgi:hypothetical protein
LPLLEVYFRSQEQGERKNLAMRAVKLLGKLGSDERWLASIAEKEAFETYQLNTTEALLKLKDFTFGNTGRDVTPADESLPSLDCVLPRVMFLAETSVDRQTKVASCELLHALVTAAIGFHAQNNNAYKKLLTSILPCVLRLAVDGDPVSSQLFSPLIDQMIHWYTTKKEYVAVADALLDAILGGIESQDNGKLREASSKFLAEFVSWTLKGLTDRKDMEDPKTVKGLLYRVYGLLNHPSATKRLGAYLAVKQLASVLKQNASNHSAIVDQFLLELLHNGIMSLRLCQHDQASMGTEKSAVDALNKLGRLMRMHNPGSDARTFAELFLEKRVDSRGAEKTRRREHEDLESFAVWVYTQIASHEKPARRYCMETLPQLAKLLHKDGPKGWVVARSSSGQDSGFAARFEDNLLSEGPIDEQPLKVLTARYARLETALDVYAWLLKLDYARPSALFVKTSHVAKSFGQFVEQSKLEIARLFPTATPTERRKHALQKSKCIYAQLKMLETALSTSDSKEHGAIPKALVSPEMLRMLVLCLLAPGRALDLDEIGDPLVQTEIPSMFKRFCLTLQQKAPALWAQLQAAVTHVLAGPNLELRDLQRTLDSIGSDSFATLLHGHAHLSDAQLAMGQGQGAGDAQESLFETGVEKWLWEVHFKERGEFEPSFKPLAHSLLQVALRRLPEPRKVWGLFRALHGIERWRQSPEWAFYLELREDLDAYVGDHTNLLKQFLLPHIGKVDREYMTTLLHNVIDGQCRAVSDSVEADRVWIATDDDVATVCMDFDEDRKDWVDYLMEMNVKGDGSRALPSWAATQDEYDHERRKSAVEVLGRLLLLLWRRKEAAGAGGGAGGGIGQGSAQENPESAGAGA